MPNLREAPFAGDDGGRSESLSAALIDFQREAETGFLPVIAALQDARVLVPVVAILGEIEYDENGLARDKSSEMAAVSITGQDGRSALLAFTCTESLAEWDPKARPVPVTFRQAAQAAIHDGADAVLVDISSARVAIDGDLLKNLAVGHQLVKAGNDWAWLVGQRTDEVE
ncbi:MAG: SseB family protein [Nocardioidaceae bacterium]